MPSASSQVRLLARVGQMKRLCGSGSDVIVCVSGTGDCGDGFGEKRCGSTLGEDGERKHRMRLLVGHWLALKALTWC